MSTIPIARPLLTALTASAALLVAAPAAGAHGVGSGELGVRGMSEHQLRRFETQVLGPEHAAEHAAMRQAIRQHKVPTSLSRSSTRAAPVSRAAAAETGSWAPAFNIPVMAIHAALLPTGKVIWFAYPKNPNPNYGGDPSQANNQSHAWLYDPGNGSFKQVDPPLWRDPADGKMKPVNLWCGGQTHLANGDLLVVGGNLQYSPPANNWKGLNKAYTFNAFNQTWHEQPDMRHGRWYPTAVRMADGRVPILGGYDESGNVPNQKNTDVELFTPSADRDGRGTMTLLGNTGGSGQPPTGGLYPHMFSMPSGRVLVAGPDPRDSWFLSPPGGSNAFSWTDALNPADREWGTGVIMPGGVAGSTRVMLMGGSVSTTSQSVATTETLDESNAGAGWQSAPSLNYGRGHANTVLLPDGSMVEVGGGVGYRADKGRYSADDVQKQVELWDPSTGQWRLGAAQAESRAYHSTALLLPDGRVISAGDDFNGGIDKDTAEIYSPPYLFKGARPDVAWAPAHVRWGQSFDVLTHATNVARASLVALGATTHANDMNQRYIQLSVSRRKDGVTLTSPDNANVAPPGYYMLFLVNDQGVPSVAKFVQVGNVAAEHAPAALPPTGTGEVLGVSGHSPAPGCLAQHLGVGRRTLAGIGLGNDGGAILHRLGAPARRTPRAWRYCVTHGGRVLALFSRRGHVAEVVTTASGHQRGHIHPGSSFRALRRRFADRGLSRIAPGVWRVMRGPSRRIVFGVRRGRVRYIAVASRGLLRSPDALLRYASLAGVAGRSASKR